MEPCEIVGSMISGMLIGALIAIVALSPFVVEGSNAMLQQCEAELPRTQHCIMIAVPEEIE